MSFKRKTSRPAAPTATVVSTGVPSLDDILGGGLPLSCSLVLTAPDLHSEYAELVQKYFVAQGLATQQHVCVIGATVWTAECMWLPPNAQATVDPDEPGPSEDKITIAWRYEQMKPFQTTVPAPSAAGAVDACRMFDLTARIPSAVIADAQAARRLTVLPVETGPPHFPTTRALVRLEELLAANTASTALRVCVPGLGSPHWGDLIAQDILRFLHGLRALLRRYPHACASVSLAAEWSSDASGTGWHQKLGWFADAAITMDAFTANPALAAAFPGHHGLLRIHTLPAPTSLVPASDRFSTLRGTGGAGGGENNLGYRCTRKRLVFETVHLDVEGGVGERRTSAPPGASAGASVVPPRPAGAAVEVEVEGAVAVEASPEPAPPKKSKKRVGFQSDRPEVYDF
ncbi:PAXNEB-domain-containing protein [Mycena vitilis]|nr:PAXNEB-domain-containing protein [Mycena vitilis]